MSAETQSKQKFHATAANCVLPQQVQDPTILDSVAGFIHDVALHPPSSLGDSKDHIQWARFECVDAGINDELPAPILLVLAYTSGVQIWAVPANGEAVEILSWRHGSVRVLRILPQPQKVTTCNKKSSDLYAGKRPLIALCDNVAPGTDYCSLSFISLKTGEQVKVIKFKNPILDVVANKRSIVVTFTERIAVFDAFTLEDRLTVTTCYLSPGLYPNPIALGSRWLAYAENKLIAACRSSGGNEGEGVQSYTATVLHAAKSLGRGLRELGETVACTFTGNNQPPPSLHNNKFDDLHHHHTNQLPNPPSQHKGIVTILDIETSQQQMIAHFTAHKEAIVYLCFDPSGMLLLTADKRGYDFHLFRIHPHPNGSNFAQIQHLYVLHRGDTTARVQDVTFAPDTRWVAVSTLRGTTHVFPITPYGGGIGVRTHSTPHVVNKLSRFHRSAGLNIEARTNTLNSFPIIINALAQIRQSVNNHHDDQFTLRLCALFAPARAWIDPQPPNVKQTKPLESLFVISHHGCLIQYDLDPHHSPAIPKEKVCDDTLIELSVNAKAQWMLQRSISGGKDVQLPLNIDYLSYVLYDGAVKEDVGDDDERWLAQVEIVTHAGPHRRLWMGPQFSFKTYNNGNNAGAPMNILETQAIEMVRSKPVNMPLSSAYPILIEAGSVSSCEPSPKLLDTLQRNFEEVGGGGVGCAGELQLREDLADAMLESPGVRETGGRCVIVSMMNHNTTINKPHPPILTKVVNPLGTVVTIHEDDADNQDESSTTEKAHNNKSDEESSVVIHENCDEALFRPLIESKAVLFAEPKNIKSKSSIETVENIILHHEIAMNNKMNLWNLDLPEIESVEFNLPSSTVVANNSSSNDVLIEDLLKMNNDDGNNGQSSQESDDSSGKLQNVEEPIDEEEKLVDIKPTKKNNNNNGNGNNGGNSKKSKKKRR